jgi:putative endonuclease
MAEHLELGRTGEEIALSYLREKGYKVLDTNWRSGKYEVDIIARDGNFIVFIEVKTRRSDYFGSPEAAVDRTKQRFMIRAADQYITRKNINLEARFDILTVLIKGGGHEINHITDAFYPLL